LYCTVLYCIDSVLHCHQRRTEPWSQLARTENLVKFGHVIFETSKWTDRRTDTLTTILAAGKVISQRGVINQQHTAVSTEATHTYTHSHVQFCI